MPKPKVAFYWCASCGGCEEAIVDLGEGILGVLEAVDIVMWPCAMDFKRADLAALPDQSITATFLNGAIRSTEQAEMAHLLRRKSQHLFAFGACAQMGGIPGLANQFTREQMLRFVYEECPSTDNQPKQTPEVRARQNGYTLHLPQLYEHVRPLHQVTEVDYSIPGCPPMPSTIQAALTALLSGKLPPKGSVLGRDTALCDECPRKDTKPADLSFAGFSRPHLAQIDPQKCLLAQGLICMGPATRAGCGAACIGGNMPCSGCYGPTSRVRDQGAKALSSICANIQAKEEGPIREALNGIPDPVGTFYRYGLAASPLRGTVDGTSKGNNSKS